jgi:ligand-binding sensor domain-containing protein
MANYKKMYLAGGIRNSCTLQAQQNYVFHHLTSKDGLGSEFIQSIFQDSKGFYWIGTTSGLQKFDGYRFA